MEAILYAYQVPKQLVDAIMSLYKGAKAGIQNEVGDIEDEDAFDLSVGVLQGDTLAPYLFVIVIDFIMRRAMVDLYGIKLAERSGTTRRGTPATYLTDLDFADDIVLFGSTIANAQKLISNLEKEALIVGLRVNQMKTEYILIGDWGNKIQKTIKIKNGNLNKVDDYKYLGSWLFSSEKDFKVRKDLAWRAIIRLFRIWKADHISREIKVNLFRATVESILLYNATTWTMTKTLEKSLDGAYTKLLSVRLRERRLIFAGHCWRSSESARQPISDLLFWSVPGGINKPGNWSSYVKILLEDVGEGKVKKKDLKAPIDSMKVDMLDRKQWK
eukprot:gene38333-51774_t